ncbi:DUF1553 domain-containing protein [Maioricimonas sp. JC845]|uniref:DUF1553 domain-containing protein n=1 Tax=Maioricimonas sp. JC845 TaxID=3232138 RepID=UPI00345A6C42
MRRTGRTVIAALLAVAGIVAAGRSGRAEELTAQQRDFFETKIRPVLVRHCYECHSAESESVKGGLLVDHAQGLTAGGDSGMAIVPGKPDESLLLEAMRYESYEMPPDQRLPENVLKDFETWIAMGAPDPRTEPTGGVARQSIDIEQGRQFWSFRPPQRHETPDVSDADWPRTWIDRFILARLEAEGLEPAEDASRERLLRRLSYDLTGLPPSPEELEAFVHDDSPDAVAKVVDRLMERPQFGEHWGRHWLDVARYADSNGSDFNATFHNAWRYRDYVIRAFNSDKPFNEFVREQIAGDLLPWETDAERTDQIVATGFLMLGPKMLSERDKMKLRMDVVDEQIDSVGRAFLGMTLGCARCHDHKFDPIPTHDYYALAGIFRSTETLDGEIQKYVSNWTRQPLPMDPEHEQALAEYKAQRDALTSQIRKAKEELKLAEAKAAETSARRLGVLVDDVDAIKTGDWKPSTYSPNFIGKGYVHDAKQDKGEKEIRFEATLAEAGEYEVRLVYPGSSGRDKRVPVRVEHADGVAELTVDQSKTAPIEQMFLPLGRFRFEAGQKGAVIVSNAGTTDYVMADAAHFLPVAALEELARDGEAASQAQQALAAAKKMVKDLEAELKALEKGAPPPAPRALAVREHTEIGDCEICIRGDHHNAGPVAPRGFLQVALFDEPPEFPESQSGRLELADWLADDRNPLTARVIVNRVWGHLIGEGIVRTVDNFGELGDRPSHPELLDRLAVEFVEQGWSLKWLVRQIVLSRVYQQDSAHSDEAWNRDPDNRLLWRAHRRRIMAESLRDSMLAIAGKLDAAPGGPPVDNLGTLVTQNRADDKGYEQGNSISRTIYLPIIRNELPALLTAFDFADPDFVTGKRSTTTVPAQALLMLNSPLVRERAAETAERLLAGEAADGYERVDAAYRLILIRGAEPHEIERALAFVERDTSEAGREAWTQFVQALFATTEFRMLD